METNDLYVAVMYAKSKKVNKIIRMFLVTPIKEYGLFSINPTIKGYKEAITDTVLIKGISNKDINNRNIEWDILDRKADNLIPESEIERYINIDKVEMIKLLNLSKEEAINLTTNKHIKIKTKC